MTTLQDVADAVGVSKSVASRALNRDSKARISAQTRAKVIEAAAALNYVPDHRGRALRSLRAGTIALIVPNVNNAVFADLLTGIQQSAEAAGMVVVLAQKSGPTAHDTALAQVVGQGRVDGIVLQRREDTDDATLADVIDVGLPVVLFNSTLADHHGSVVLDDHAAAVVATRHLIDLGHHRIAFIGGTVHHDAARRRLEGFRSTMREAGLTVIDDWTLDAGWEAESGDHACARLLVGTERPSAVVVASVNAALGAASRALREGLAIPGDLSLVAIQDTWMAQVFSPPLTVVKLPLLEAGRRAARMLTEHLEGAELRDVVVSDPEPALIERGSTSPVRRT